MWNVICGPRFLVFSLFIVVIFIVDTKRLEEFRSNFAIGEQFSHWKNILQDVPDVQDVQDMSLAAAANNSSHSLPQPSNVEQVQSFLQNNQSEQFHKSF